MEELLNLLKDGRSRSVELLATELNTTKEDILRRMEFLERAGMIRRVLNTGGSAAAATTACHSAGCTSCSGCTACSSSHCSGCMPEGGFKNMGQMWEVVN